MLNNTYRQHQKVATQVGASHPSLSDKTNQPVQRKIIHLDCDCFFAAVEMLDDPRLRNLPLAVGGDKNRRGVIAACNYEARASGVRSAMSSAHAKRLCPSLLIVPPRFERYREISQQIFSVYQNYAEELETLSLDEAFIDVSESQQYHGSATWIARAIKKEVYEKTGIVVSAGVAPNKFLAKIASDWNKPDGLFVITPEQTDEFVKKLPIESIFGVGPATASKMHQLDLYTCADLRELSALELARQFGLFGERLFQLSRGIDERKIKSNKPRKSLSIEHTYAHDLANINDCIEAGKKQIDKLQQRLATQQSQRSQAEQAPRQIIKLFVKVRFNDFTTTSMECVGFAADENLLLSLLKAACQRSEKAVRLLGVGVRFRDLPSKREQEQLLLPFQSRLQ